MRFLDLGLALILLAFALFCVFGFLASFEPGADWWGFKVGYAALGLTSLAAASWLIRRATRPC